MKGVNYREIRGMPFVRREYIRGKPQNKIARFASGQPKNNYDYLLELVVTEVKFKDQLRNKGFGETFNNEYILSSLETLYLLNNNKIKLQGKKEYDFPLLLNVLLKKDKRILSKYLIYRDLRSKGYVVKEGFGFGNDFRIYERGEYGKKPSKYVSVGINEGLNIKSKDFVDIIEQIENMGKDTVIAVIERRGEIIYYKTIKMSFFENIRKK